MTNKDTVMLQPKATILIVDDVKMMRMALKRILTGEGHEVLEAENGAKALNALRMRKEIDLVVTDVDMPELNGLDMLRRIRADAETAGIPVIMCSSTRSKQDVLDAAQWGIQGFLLKPINPGLALDMIRNVLNAAKQ